ncbi:SAICAR synthase-like protein [Dendrothele bispora CBS 962.96]|uniref:Kinase n=1 Tax=Dendrothele bispora (strain CBS 962.96) TaxID=1314807 RepID=A0A4S8MUG8_DENBC|nr:SAICAR synthase-like protein [Dendrothele bispora CBS 962.96]
MASSSSLDHTRTLASQVGGHAGVQTTEDGSLIIKPALPLEHKFYLELTTSDAFAALRPYVPRFFGTLKLEGEVDETKSNTGGGIVIKETDTKEHKDKCCFLLSLVLENLSHPFLKPNILDAKLGTVLYDEEASPDKVERMLKTARETTSLETGVRLTGFQVYDNATSQPINTPKSYGKSIKPSDLPEGIRRFFPISSAESSSGLPANLLLPILQYLREDIAEIRGALADLHFRMVGGSLLIIYEADFKKAEEGIQWVKDVEEGKIDPESDEDEDDDKDGEDAAKKQKPRSPYVVKLIDFAHTRIKPGEGPDEGVLKGIDTVLSLLDGRIKEVEALLGD